LGDHYEYIARFVDDVIAFSKDPMAIMKELEKNYIMKGVGKPLHYLGGDVVELYKSHGPRKEYSPLFLLRHI
jgi:hypothetical protein